jgi:Protein of unknown function (DUF1569)
MNRRRFMNSMLLTAGGTALLGGAGVWAFHHHFESRNGAKRLLSYASLAEALQEIQNLRQAHEQLVIEGNWTLLQHLTHCKQSIAFSLQGYPENKSPFFQQTIGKWVFNKFEQQGYMRHNRNEPIPQAPALPSNGDIVLAFMDLEQTIVAFDTFEGELKPHFAYGNLSKKQYAKAHAMHLADHFSIMTV